MIPVEGDLVVGGRFHLTSKSAPNILFFMGMGKSLPITIRWGLSTTAWV